MWWEKKNHTIDLEAKFLFPNFLHLWSLYVIQFPDKNCCDLIYDLEYYHIWKKYEEYENKTKSYNGFQMALYDLKIWEERRILTFIENACFSHWF